MTISFVIFDLLIVIVDHVKRRVRTVTGEIGRCRNDNECYYCREIQHGACKRDSSLNVLWYMYERLLTVTIMGRVRETPR